MWEGDPAVLATHPASTAWTAAFPPSYVAAAEAAHDGVIADLRATLERAHCCRTPPAPSSGAADGDLAQGETTAPPGPDNHPTSGWGASAGDISCREVEGASAWRWNAPAATGVNTSAGTAAPSSTTLNGDAATGLAAGDLAPGRRAAEEGSAAERSIAADVGAGYSAGLEGLARALGGRSASGASLEEGANGRTGSGESTTAEAEAVAAAARGDETPAAAHHMLFALPSFLNHSSVTNVSCVLVGCTLLGEDATVLHVAPAVMSKMHTLS